MYQITLERNDFIRFHLFTASKSKRVKKQRVVSRIAFSVIFLCLAGLFALSGDSILAITFLIIAGIGFFLFPLYLKGRYPNFFEKHVNENYKNRIGVPCELEFIDGQIFSRDSTSEGKVKLAEIEEINEIDENLFVKMKTGFTFIFPKKMIEFEAFKKEFENLIKDLNIKWNSELDWKWK